MPKPVKGKGKSSSETGGKGAERDVDSAEPSHSAEPSRNRLPRDPMGPYHRPLPVDGSPMERRMWASERRTTGERERTVPGLLDVMVDQLPMLTEKGLRELLVATSCELSFRGDVREENEEVRMAHAKGGGTGSPFPPEELLRVVHPEFTGDERAREARSEEVEVDEDFEVEDEPLIAPGDGDRYWDEHGEERFFSDGE